MSKKTYSAVFYSGWAAAVALGAWWAMLPDTAQAPEEVVSQHEAKPIPVAVAEAGTGKAVAEKLPASYRKVATPTELRGRGAPRFRELSDAMSEVPPGSAEIVARMRAAYESMNLEAALACAGDAAASPDPNVRRMAVALLRAFVGEGYGAQDVKADCDDATRLAVVAALKAFANDGDTDVRDGALDAWCRAIWGLGDADACTAAFQEAFSCVGSDFFLRNGRNFHGIYPPTWRPVPRNACVLALARHIDGLGDGEVRDQLRGEYERIVGPGFDGVDGAERYVTWCNDILGMGTRIYGDEWHGNAFLNTALTLMQYDSDVFTGIDDEEIEDACRKFASPSTATLYVASLKRLRDKAAKRFGGTENEEAQAWIEEERRFMELRYHESEKKKLEERK